jgi:hypothetical protein
MVVNWREFASCTIVVSAVQIACGGDLPLPQPGRPPAARVASRIRQRVPSSQESAAALFRRMVPIVGMRPEECGRHFLRNGFEAVKSELDLSLQCGLTAARAKRPFWIFVERRGVDSWIAEGLLGGSDGVIQLFSYDSSPGGNPFDDSRFRLTISSCARPAVVAHEGRVMFSCVERPS